VTLDELVSMRIHGRD